MLRQTNFTKTTYLLRNIYIIRYIRNCITAYAAQMITDILAAERMIIPAHMPARRTGRDVCDISCSSAAMLIFASAVSFAFPAGMLSARRNTTAFSKYALSGKVTSTIRLFTPFIMIFAFLSVYRRRLPTGFQQNIQQSGGGSAAFIIAVLQV